MRFLGYCVALARVSLEARAFTSGFVAPALRQAVGGRASIHGTAATFASRVRRAAPAVTTLKASRGSFRGGRGGGRPRQDSFTEFGGKCYMVVVLMGMLS